ncbi:MAG: hypothetical protein AB7I50_22355, partial [Vicinamibacterales bacterium]
TVNSVVNTITFTQAPSGAPNPVASGGNVAASVVATNSLNRTLTYAWSATCAGPLGGDGSFANGNTATPTWTAPANTTASAQTCSLRVTVQEPISGLSQEASYVQTVFSESHTLTLTQGPAGAPNPVASAGLVAVSVVASDSLNRPLTYVWSASCAAPLGAHGSFTNGDTPTPLWTAPVNLTGGSQTCSIQVVVTEPIDGVSQIASYLQTVNSAPHTVTITEGPSGTPNPVASSGIVNASVVAVDSLNRPLSYAWSAACSGGLGNGLFANGTTASPTWTAPANLTGSSQTCIIHVVVSEPMDTLSLNASYIQTITSVPQSITITSGPLATPNPVNASASTTLSVVVQDVLGRLLHYAWTADCPASLEGEGSFADSSATVPVWTAPENGSGGSQLCRLSVTIDDGAGTSVTGQIDVEVLPGQTGTSTEYRYYFAEGATIGGFFDTRFALLNADPTDDASVSLEFQLKGSGAVLAHQLVVPAHTRSTVDVAQLAALHAPLAVLASAEFSTVVRSDRPLVTDRTMTWDQNGYGSHAESAVSGPASKWYLAEGATIGNFELYYLIQNPNPVGIDYTVTYLLPPPAAPIVRIYHVGPNTRENIAVHVEPGLGDVEVSAIIESAPSTPIIVERAMYLTTGGHFYGAGHESAGIRAPETQWFFAEGATGPFFDLFILIGNPSPTPAHVTATFLFDDGTACSTTTDVGAMSRFNFWVDTLVIPGCPRSLADAAVSTTITADVPVIAERAMWWPGPSPANWAEAHNAAGATETGLTWGLADGEQGGARDTETYILVANTSPYAGIARVTLYLEDGSALQQDVALAANSRTNVAVGAVFGAAVHDTRFGAVVDSVVAAGQLAAAQLVVERAMYSNGPGAPFWAAGTDALATKLR